MARKQNEKMKKRYMALDEAQREGIRNEEDLDKIRRIMAENATDDLQREAIMRIPDERIQKLRTWIRTDYAPDM